MRMKITAAVTALALGAGSMLVATPASARWHHRHHGNGGAAVFGLAAGAILGSALAANRPYYYGGGPYAYSAPYGGDAVRYCLSRFKSYDPASGTYLGYDGYRHPCP